MTLLFTSLCSETETGKTTNLLDFSSVAISLSTHINTAGKSHHFTTSSQSLKHFYQDRKFLPHQPLTRLSSRSSYLASRFSISSNMSLTPAMKQMLRNMTQVQIEAMFQTASQPRLTMDFPKTHPRGKGKKKLGRATASISKTTRPLNSWMAFRSGYHNLPIQDPY